MHTVELLEQAVEAARQRGYIVRHENLAGAHGGPCEFGGKRWIFIDLSVSVAEQLDQVLEGLVLALDDSDGPNSGPGLPMPLARAVRRRAAA